MSGRLDVAARLMMNPDDYVRGVRLAKKETKGLDGQINKTGKASKKTSNEISKLGKNTKKAGDSSKKTGKDFASLTKSSNATALSISRLAGYIGPAALGAVLISSGKAAAVFQKKMSEVATLLDDTSSIDGITQSVREMAIEYGSDAPAQASAMYQIISAGAEDAAEANEILAASNKLAIGGVTEITIAADGLTSVLNAYGDQVEDATAVSDAMFVAMKAGKTTIGELSGSVGSAAPLAATLGVEFNELLASTSALTLGGVSTSEAMTGVRATLVAITKPTAEAKKLAKELGIEFNTGALRAKGLSDFLLDLKEKTGGNTEVMAEMFGSVEALNTVLALTGNQAGAFTDILIKLDEKAGATAAAVSEMTDNFDFEYDQLIANFKDIGLSLGEGVLPPLTDVLAGFNELFAVLGSGASTGEKTEGWINHIAGVFEANSYMFGLLSDEAEELFRSIRTGTSSFEGLIAKQKELDHQFAEGEKSLKGLLTAEEHLNKEFEEGIKLLDGLGESHFDATDKTKDHAEWLKKTAAAANQATKEFDELLREVNAEAAAEFKAKKANIDFTKSFEDQIKVLKVRVSQGEIAARIEEDWIRAQEDGIDVTRDQIVAYYDQIGALEGLLGETESAADQWGKIWNNAVENMQRESGELLYGILFEDPIESWDDFTDTALDMFKRMAAEMVNAWLVSGIIGLLNGDGISGFSVGKLFGGAAGGAGGSALGGIGASITGSAAYKSIFGATASTSSGVGGTGLVGGGLPLLGPSIAGTGGTLAAPAIASQAEVAALTAQWSESAAAVGEYSAATKAASTSTSGATIAAGGFVAALAGIALYGALGTSRREKENAKLTDQFNVLRTQTNEFAGELVAVNDNLSIVGQTSDAMYVSLLGTQEERQTQLLTYAEAIKEAGAEMRFIYQEGEQSIHMITGNIAEAHKIIEEGFEHAKLSFDSFTEAGINGLTGMTAKMRGDTGEWTRLLQGAMNSGAVSARASFGIIEDESGNTFLRLRGQANEWAEFLGSQGRVAAESFAGSMRYMDSEGEAAFANLSAETMAFQALLSSLRAPDLQGSVAYSTTAPTSLTTQVTGFADGGISRSPQLAYVSEGRYAAEAHVPLPDGRTIPVTIRGDNNSKDVVVAINKLGDRMAAVEEAVLAGSGQVKQAVDKNTDARPDDLDTYTRRAALERVGVAA
ncbi:MAG: phage tail tape measure protein [Arenicellales bacterium]